MKTALHRLTTVDVSGLQAAPLTIGSLINQPVDPAKVESALTRVTDKWRTLAGRAEWDHKLGTWAIRVPTGEIPSHYPRFSFQSTTSSGPAPFSIPNLSSTSAEIVLTPPLEHFKVAGAPATVAEMAKQSKPLVAVRVATFADCLTIGLSVPHGVFDGMGFGMIIKALEAELAGREWSAPPIFEETNPLGERLKEMEKEAAYLPPHDLDLSLRHMSSGSANSLKDTARLLLSITKEITIYKASVREIFLGRELFGRLVEDVKADVKATTNGSEWVSTGDVLVAWTQNALWGSETRNHRPLVTLSCLDFRRVASTPSRPLTSYPHNNFTVYIHETGPVSSLSSTPLSTLALANRRAIEATRSVPAVVDTLKWMHSTQFMPARRKGTEGLFLTNQISAGLPNITWGAPKDALKGWWVWLMQPTDHVAVLNELPTGWLVTVSTRASRWKSVQAELEKLKKWT